MSIKPVSTLIHAGIILPVDDQNTVLHDHTLVVDQGLIVDLLPKQEALARYQSDEVVDLPEHTLIPGLVNAHAHSPMVLLRGLGDDQPLFDWLQKHIWPAEAALVKPDFMRDGTMLAVCEMLRSGTTCFAEHYFYPELTASVAAEMGMRVQVGLWVGDVKTPWASDAASCLKLGKQAYDGWQQAHPKHPLVSFAIAPHSPYMVSDAVFKSIVAWRDADDLRVHIHLHETAQEIKDSERAYGMRPLARLHQLGLVDARLQAVHMTQMNAEDTALMAKQGASMVTCPASNLKLASGFAPTHKALHAGIVVGLGTDGAASNNGLNMLADMRLAALLGKAASQDPTQLPATDVLRMATLGGARALGIDDQTGSLSVGKAADVVAIHTGHFSLQPAHNPYVSVVYAHAAEHISDVWIAGKRQLKDRLLLDKTIDKIDNMARLWKDRTKNYA